MSARVRMRSLRKTALRFVAGVALAMLSACMSPRGAAGDAEWAESVATDPSHPASREIIDVFATQKDCEAAIETLAKRRPGDARGKAICQHVDRR